MFGGQARSAASRWFVRPPESWLGKPCWIMGVGWECTSPGWPNHTHRAIGLEYDFERAAEAHKIAEKIVSSAGEALPFPDRSISFILSHEVLEHVQRRQAGGAGDGHAC